MSRNQILVLFLVLFITVGYAGYKTFIASPCMDFGKVLVKKERSEEVVDLASLQGKVTLVAFFQTWCGDCIREMPTILALENKIQNKELKVIMITDEPIEKLDKFKQKFPEYNFQYFLSTNKLTEYGVKKYPTTYLVDKNGRILKSTLEGFDWSSNDIIELVSKELK